MARSGYPGSPVVMRGALVQLVEDLGIIIPNIVPFQYNPAKVTRGFETWNPFNSAPQNQAAQTPLVQPFDPHQTYRFDLEFDAADDLEWGNPIAQLTGVASRLAALKKLIEPTQGLLTDLIASAGALAGDTARQAETSKVPITLLVLGPGTILPVRVTDLTIDITEFTPGLYPLMAKATVALQVLTPDVFKCTDTAASKIAVAAFKLTKLQDDALAIANVVNVASGAASMIPL